MAVFKNLYYILYKNMQKYAENKLTENKIRPYKLSFIIGELLKTIHIIIKCLSVIFSVEVRKIFRKLLLFRLM